ncbi:MAG: helix-turn-helix transcriptional regulator [Candidatus Contendobacter sp.]
MTIGQRIKQARLAHQPKITQQQLAAEVGISRPAVTQWETGETKSLEGENLVRVAQALSVTTEWLLYGTGAGPSESMTAKRTVRTAENKPVFEIDETVLQVALAIQSLPPKDRASLQKIVDALTQQVDKADVHAANG